MPSQRNHPSFARLREVLPTVDRVSDVSEPKRQGVEGAASTEEGRDLGVVAPDTLAFNNVASPPAEGDRALPNQLTRSVLPARPGRRKSVMKTNTFRLPVELQEALRRVAEYNNLNQGDIVAESICLHLPNFTWPDDPESHELRNKLHELLSY